jgi:hypothetical protein
VAGVSNNNDRDPAASTQMFRAFVSGQTPNSPTPATAAPSGSGNLGKAVGVVLAVVVIALIIYFVA